jgi:hypothetical protein
MEHKPRGFLSNVDGAVNLPRAYPVLAVRDHPHCGKPLVQTEWGIFTDSPCLGSELPPVMAIVALPAVVLFLKGYVLASTTRANNALRPTTGHNVLAAIAGIREVNDSLLKSAGFHRSKYDLD